MKSKELQQVLGKFLKSEAAGNARVQVVLPNGEYYDITGMQKKPPGPCSVKLYPGSMVLELADRETCSPIAESWPEVQLVFDSLSM
jgi:hypothetical protein